MRDSSAKAVAVDLGASSIRYAVGSFQDGKIEIEVIRQVPNSIIEEGGAHRWDMSKIMELCREAEAFAAHQTASLGIDSWGVDIGFLDPVGGLVENPVAYRDESHVSAFHQLAEHRNCFYQETGIAHQPFNTVYQLYARGKADEQLKEYSWRMMPELVLHLLGADAAHEVTNASTTQLLGANGDWAADVFNAIEWPIPAEPVVKAGTLAGHTLNGVPCYHVGTHDTASAIAGLGNIPTDQAYLSAGTWSLLGSLVENPIINDQAQRFNFTNERATDGSVRFLKNIPGFFIANSLYSELKIEIPFGDWLLTADDNFSGRIDVQAEEFFNPDSMVAAIKACATRVPGSDSDWASVALFSLCDAIKNEFETLGRVTGRTINSVRLCGGGVSSEAFCKTLSKTLGKQIISGPRESTLLGNIGLQFLASGVIQTEEELDAVLLASVELVRYDQGERI